MDFGIANWIYNTFGNSAVFANIAKIITYLGNKWVIIAIALVFMAFKKTRKMGFFVAVACGVTYILNDYIIKEIIARKRPFEINPELAKMSELAGLELPDGYSMPSGHAAVSMALAIIVFMFNHKYGLIAIGGSALVGLSRVALCVHYFSDICVGFVVGIVFAVAVYYSLEFAIRFIEKKKKSKKIVFASNNAHKLNEVRQILKGFEVLSLKDIGFEEDVEENGATLEENAQIKARAIKKHLTEKNLDYIVFSDDSGLFVNALGGEPGVFSARYDKAHNDEANRQKLLNNLKRKRDRSAYFECVICLIVGNEEKIFSGKTYGTITKEYIGDTSFGYDCIFLSDDLNKSFGEASKEEKDAVSHRGRAVETMKEYLEKKL